MKDFKVSVLLIVAFAFSFSIALPSQAQSAGRRPVVYVMPNPQASPGTVDNSQVVVDSAHGAQVAKIYQELQHTKACQDFMENMVKEKADYFLLLQRGGGGKQNRWAVSDKGGSVIASGESLIMGNSVKDACLAMAKDWQQHAASAGN